MNAMLAVGCIILFAAILVPTALVLGPVVSRMKKQDKFELFAFIIATLVGLTLILMCVSCCSESVEPGYPYGAPDNITRYDHGGGAVEVTYLYRCLDGERTKVVYFREDKCSNYTLIAEHKSEGICP